MIDIVRNSKCGEQEEEFFHCSFCINDEQQELARTTMYINPHHKVDGKQVATIGYFDCVDSDEVFKFLMDAVAKEASALGLSYLIGPMDGSTWNTYRLVSSKQDDPFLLELETPSFYIDLYKNYGFTTLAKYLSTKTSEIVDNWDRIEARYDAFVDSGIVFKPFNKENARAEFESLAVLCNQSFAKNVLFSPITTNRFVEKMMPSIPLINPRYTILAKDKGMTVGFIFCYQDLNNKVEKTIVVKTLARDLSDRYKGIGSVLSSLAMKNVKADGFTKGIHALMVDFNTSTYISSNFEANFLRSYELLSYKIVH